MVEARADSPEVLLGRPALSYVESGTIGWEDDTDASYFSKGTDADDGFLLLNVQLFRGKPPTTTPKAGVGQGARIICMVNTMFGHRIPARGTRCTVMAPGGDWETHGNPVIVAVTDKNPVVQLDPKRVVEYYGDDVHKVTKGASVSMQDTPPDGASCFVGVGTPFTGGGKRGIYALDETGSGFSTQSGELGMFSCDGGDAVTMVHLSATEIDVISKTGGVCGFKAGGGDATVLGANGYIYTAAVYLGANAILLNTVLFGTSGPLGLPSATVFIAP